MNQISKLCTNVIFIITCCNVSISMSADADIFKLRQMVSDCKKAESSNCQSVCMDAFIATRKAAPNADLDVKKCYAEHSNLQLNENVNSFADDQAKMPDIEGVYLSANRNGFIVRAEDNEDWKIYCNEAARIRNGQKELSRTVKAYDRIRLIGITYDPNKANARVTHCIAESALILGPSMK